MIIILPCLSVAILLGCVLLVVMARPGATPVWREVSFPSDLDADDVQAFLRQVAALRSGPVSLVVCAEVGEIKFLLGAPGAALQALEAALNGLLPQLRLDEANAPGLADDSSQPVWGASVFWAGRWPVLRSEQPEQVAAGLLGALTNLRANEQLLWQARFWPAPKVDRPVARSERAAVPTNPWFVRLWWSAQPPGDEVRPVRQKYSDLLLATELLVVARADSAERAAQLGHRLVVAARAAGGSRGVLRYRASRSRAAVDRWQRTGHGLPLWRRSTLLCAAEAVGLIGWPIGSPSVAGVSYGAGPRLMAPRELPTQGRVFAVSTFPATRGRVLAQPIAGGLQHTVCVGPTGTGKSTLIGNLVAADMAAGRGALVVDLKGDLVSELLTQVPDGRSDDVVLLEPARGGAQPGLQLFPVGGEPELTSDLVLGTLSEIFRDSWGVRSSQYLGMGLRTLASLPGATLLQLPLLFSDQAFRTAALERVSDPWLLASWQRFAGLSSADQAAQLASPLTKLSELVSRSRLRLVLGQAQSKLDFRQVLARRQIVLVSLPPGLLGMPATRLLSALCLWQFFQAVEGRAALEPHQRSPFMAYVDEVAVLSNLPLPLDGILERARGHGVGLTLAPQALSQLSPSLRASLLANVGSLVAFKQNSDAEAQALAKALPGVTAEQLMCLGRHEVAMRLSIGPGVSTSTMTGLTLPPADVISEPETIRRHSAERFGQSIESVDAELQRWQREDHRSGPTAVLGVRRRQPGGP